MNTVLEAREASVRYLDAVEPPLVQKFDLLAGAPGGVARLRELILCLATAGRLAVTRCDQSHWQRLALDQVGEWGSGGTPSKSHPEYYAGGTIPWLVIGDLNDGVVQSAATCISDLGLRNSSAKIVEPGTVLVAMYGSIGKLGVAGLRCATNQAIAFCRPNADVVTGDFLFLFLRSIRASLLQRGQGLAQQNISQKILRNIEISVPPLAEQARIVARVGELMQLCDALEAKGRLEAQQHARLLETLLGTLTDSTTPEELAANWQRVAEHSDLLLDRPEAVDVLEQTVLQLAVRGLLVPQDRNDIPPARLISTGPGRSPVPPHSTIPPDQSESNVETGLLPSGWELVQLHQVADTRLGKMLDKSKNRGLPRPYLRNTNVQWGRFDLGDVKTMNLEESELQEFRLAVGDLLICEGGEPGRCAIWRDDEREMYFQKALHRVRPHAGVSAEYIAIALESDAISGALDEYFTGATIKHFVGQALQRYTFALPPAAEQARIVARVTELRRLCAELRHCLAASQATQSRLAGALVESVETT